MDPRIAGRRQVVAESRARSSLRRLGVVIVVAMAIAVVLWTFRSPFLSIHEISIVGADVVDVGGLLAEAGITQGLPLVEVDTEHVEAHLLSNPWVAQAAVVRDWPEGLIVRITERVAVGWVETTSGWARVASDGVILAQGTPPEDAARIVGSPPGEAAANTRVAAAASFLATLSPALTIGAVVDIGGEQIVATVSGYPVRLGLPGDMVEKAVALAAVLETAPVPGSQIVLVAPSRPAVSPPTG